MLEAAGRLVKVEPHQHCVRHCYRCDTVVEPRLSDQWFVKMEPLAEPALEAVRDRHDPHSPRALGGRLRQLARGHPRLEHLAAALVGAPHPGVVLRRLRHASTRVARDVDACPHCGGTVRQDEDVLDTWFSSWLWPFSTLGWPDETRRPQRVLPDRHARHGAGDPVLLGRADGHGRATPSWASRRSTRSTCTARCATRNHVEDVQVARQRHRPARRRGSCTAPTRCARRWSPGWGWAPTSCSIRTTSSSRSRRAGTSSPSSGTSAASC